MITGGELGRGREQQGLPLAQGWHSEVTEPEEGP